MLAAHRESQQFRSCRKNRSTSQKNTLHTWKLLNNEPSNPSASIMYMAAWFPAVNKFPFFFSVVPCIIQYGMWLLAAKLPVTTLEARVFLYDENHVTFRQLAGHQICFRIWFFFRTWQWLCWLSGKIKFPSNRVKEVERASPKAKVKTHSRVLLKSLPSFFANCLQCKEKKCSKCEYYHLSILFMIGKW